MSATRRGRGNRRGLVAVVAAVALALVGGLVLVTSSLFRGGTPLANDSFTPEPPLLPGAPLVTVPTKAPSVSVSGIGFDVSYPQCRSTLPTKAAFAIVGVNGGAPLTSNRCFADQSTWARSTGLHAVYLNTANSGTDDPVAYGRKLVDDALRREKASGARTTTMWWLDVELTNTWNGTQQENATVLAAMASRLQEAGARVGIYSSPAQWTEIAGSWEPGLPVWNATGNGTKTTASPNCDESFAGSTAAIVQWVEREGGRLLDHNLVCPAWRNRGGDLFQVATR